MSSPPVLIQSLLDPGRYPHPSGPVELVETHISWVLLAGEYAYKIKKPVDLGFLDFSTLEKRRYFCDEELRLNRRLAPELYLGRITITGSPSDPHLGKSGQPIEHAVHMRRFDRDQQLDRLLVRDQLLPRHIDALASGLADFHQRIAVAGPDSPYGDPDHVWQPVEENFTQIEGLMASPSPGLTALRSWSRENFDRLCDTIAARRRDGHVRECHGDAHLANMILWNDRPLLFDCLEFNPSLRWIDVISEIAFSVMDLQDRGRPDLGWRLLNSWLERTGDYAGVTLLRFYLTYRAMVRTKVAMIRGHQSDLDDARRIEAQAEYESYLALASGYTRKQRPALIIMHGLSGSGKTTISQQVIETVGAVRVRSDVERKRLHGLAATASSRSGVASGLYARDASDRTYAQLARLAGSLLEAGQTAVVDAAFLERQRRDRFRQLAVDHGATFIVLDLVADEPQLRERIARRITAGQDASEAGYEVLAHQLTTREPLLPVERADTIEIDTRWLLSSTELAARIRQRLP